MPKYWGNPYKNYMTNQRGSTKWRDQGYNQRQSYSNNYKPGNQKKIVLVHGLFSDPKKFDKYAQEFTAKGYKVIRVKHGMPMKPSDHQHVKRMVNEHKDAHAFIGHSYGGMALASNHNIPENKIVTINSPYAKRGYNITHKQDLLNLINPISYMMSEKKYEGGHGKLPELTRLMNNAQLSYNNIIVTKMDQARMLKNNTQIYHDNIMRQSFFDNSNN